MDRQRSIGAHLALVILIAALLAAARPGESCSQECRIEAGNAYLAALVHHDGSQVPLHADAWRQENGGPVLVGGEAIRESLESPIMYVVTGIRELRWYGSGRNVVAFYILDTATSPSYIAERFLVDDDGLIREIDAHFYVDIPGYLAGPESVLTRPDGQFERLFRSEHGPLGPVPVEGKVGEVVRRDRSDCNVACVRRATDRFLDSMVSRDASRLPLASDVTMSVNRRAVAASADGVRSWLEAPNGITAVVGRIPIVDVGESVVLFEVDLGGRLSYTALRLRVIDRVITEVEILCDASVTCTG